MNITTCCLCLETCRCSDSDTDSDLEVIYERNTRVLDVASVPEVIHECKGITNGERTINIGETLFVKKKDATSKSHHKATSLKIIDERHILIEWEWKNLPLITQKSCNWIGFYVMKGRGNRRQVIMKMTLL